MSERVYHHLRRSHNTIISDGDDVNSVPWSWSSVSQCERHAVCKESSCVYTWTELCLSEDHTLMMTTRVSEWVTQHELRVIMIINVRIIIMIQRYERWSYHETWVIMITWTRFVWVFGVITCVMMLMMHQQLNEKLWCVLVMRDNIEWNDDDNMHTIAWMIVEWIIATVMSPFRADWEATLWPSHSPTLSPLTLFLLSTLSKHATNNLRRKRYEMFWSPQQHERGWGVCDAYDETDNITCYRR
jgi:hypothetical protein